MFNIYEPKFILSRSLPTVNSVFYFLLYLSHKPKNGFRARPFWRGLPFRQTGVDKFLGL